jgi:hypothetical protein
LSKINFTLRVVFLVIHFSALPEITLPKQMFMKKILLFFSFLAIVFSGFAQQENPWKSRTDRQGLILEKSVARKTFPSDFKLFTLDLPVLRRQLFTIVGNRQNHSLNIILPNADGNFEEFEVVEASNFEPALQVKFPEIRAFSGRGITDKYATLKISISPQGIQTMVMRTGKEYEFIEPYTQDHTVYSVFKSYRQPGQLPWTCSTPEEKLSQNINNQINHSGIMARSGGNLKTLRLAQ